MCESVPRIPRPTNSATLFGEVIPKLRLYIALAFAGMISISAWYGVRGRSAPPPVMAMLQLPGGGEMSATMVGHQFRQDDLPAVAASPTAVSGSRGSASSAIATTSSSAITSTAIGAICNGCPTPAAIPGCRRSPWMRRIVPGRSGRSRSTATGTSMPAATIRRSRSGDTLERLTSDPMPDINPRLTSDGKGKFALVWQGFRGKNSNIFLKTFDGEKWSADMRVTNRAANDWEPAAAIDPQGHGLGRLRQLQERQLRCFPHEGERPRGGKPRWPSPPPRAWKPVPTLTVDTAGRLWMAWEEGTPDWGKDNGYWFRKTGGRRAARRRAPPARALPDRAASGKSPTASIDAALPGNAYHPEIFSDGQGSVWVSAIRTVTGGGRAAASQRGARISNTGSRTSMEIPGRRRGRCRMPRAAPARA